MSSNTYLPPEWHPQSAILMAWPHIDTDWAYMLSKIQLCFKNIAKEIISHQDLIIVAPDTEIVKSQLRELPHSERITYIECPTNDTWARDFGVITVIRDGVPTPIDFKFNGWGLKFAADKDNLINTNLAKKGLFTTQPINQLGFVLEGGSIESDGNGSILTTSECLLSPNRNGDLSRDQIEAKLKEFFGAQQVLWLDHGFLAGDDTDSHIDTLARFAPNNTIIYTKCYDERDRHFEALQNMEQQLATFTNINGEKYNLIPVPLPQPIIDIDNEIRLPATYANFLITNEAVLVPTYNQPQHDQFALSQIAKAFPERKIIGINCNAIICQHGSLHCVTMQLPINTINK